MLLKKVGFFIEFKHSLATGTLASLISEKSLDNEDLIIKYLENGLTFIVSPGLVFDILDKSKQIISNRNILTDGIWAWPMYLAYCVKKYHVKLPEEFINHMRINQWEIKDRNEINISKLQF